MAHGACGMVAADWFECKKEKTRGNRQINVEAAVSQEFPFLSIKMILLISTLRRT